MRQTKFSCDILTKFCWREDTTTSRSQPVSIGTYRCGYWAYACCRLVEVSQTTIRSRLCSRMGGDVALADWQNLAKRALRKKKLLEGSRSNDWLRGSKGFCELRTFNIFTLHCLPN